MSAVPASPAGAGRYTIELARALAARRDTDLLFVARRSDAARWRAIGGPGDVVVAAAPAARPVRLAWEQAVLPGLLGRRHPDVHHAPHYTMPERTRLPVVVTVHDCTYFDHPEWHERTKVAVFRRAIRVAARRASVVVCVSEATARDLRSACEVTVPVVVAPHGVDHRRFAPSGEEHGADAGVLRRVGIDARRPYVLFVGTVEPRKDVATLVRAFARLAGAEPDVTLVIAGRPGWGEHGVDAAMEECREHRSRILRLGYVPDDAVAALLRGAAVVAYPSLAEGYGLPALEALACGAPLVTTAGTAMAELAGDAALLVPPRDPGALAGALTSVLGAGRADREVAARVARGLA
ncbi:MAG: glycosyltransferase family 4 protein, partial [Acidimicrobiales bacterium]